MEVKVKDRVEEEKDGDVGIISSVKIVELGLRNEIEGINLRDKHFITVVTKLSTVDIVTISSSEVVESVSSLDYLLVKRVGVIGRSREMVVLENNL